MDTEQIKDYNRRYYQEHREEIALRRLNKRHQGKQVPILSLEEWGKIKVSQRNKCLRCGKDTILTPFLSNLKVFEDRMYVGLCRACGSKTALDIANRAKELAKEKKLEEAAEVFA